MKAKPSRGNFGEGQAFQVGVCGTTERTVRVAEKLRSDPRFAIKWVVTPPPSSIGRKQILTPNPIETWASEHDLPIFPVEKSLTPLRESLAAAPAVDFLLVVDFGYLVPDWLLQLPKIAPINIHPSDLPQLRGSSPGQYVLLYGETESAVDIMRMTEGFDEGPIIARLPLAVEPTETAETYYQTAFALAAEKLPQILVDYAAERTEKPQISKTTLTVAKRFSRQDGYIQYSILEAAQNGASAAAEPLEALSPILREVLSAQPNLSIAALIERAVRALSPWPGVWTTVPDYKGRSGVRQKILASHLNNQGKLVIDRAQHEGE
jgi:methionyl-tRNA formyltransferase